MKEVRLCNRDLSSSTIKFLAAISESLGLMFDVFEMFTTGDVSMLPFFVIVISVMLVGNGNDGGNDSLCWLDGASL